MASARVTSSVTTCHHQSALTRNAIVSAPTSTPTIGLESSVPPFMRMLFASAQSVCSAKGCSHERCISCRLLILLQSLQPCSFSVRILPLLGSVHVHILRVQVWCSCRTGSRIWVTGAAFAVFLPFRRVKWGSDGGLAMFSKWRSLHFRHTPCILCLETSNTLRGLGKNRIFRISLHGLAYTYVCRSTLQREFKEMAAFHRDLGDVAAKP